MLINSQYHKHNQYHQYHQLYQVYSCTLLHYRCSWGCCCHRSTFCALCPTLYRIFWHVRLFDVRGFAHCLGCACQWCQFSGCAQYHYWQIIIRISSIWKSYITQNTDHDGRHDCTNVLNQHNMLYAILLQNKNKKIQNSCTAFCSTRL